MPTARNARGVDLLAYDVSAHLYKGIQVKALSKRYPVPLGNTLDKFMGDWWIIVTNAVSANPDHPISGLRPWLYLVAILFKKIRTNERNE